MVKLMYALRRRQGMSAEDFHQYWLETHAPLVLDVAGEKLGFQRYVQSHTIQTSSDESLRSSRNTVAPEYDGVAEVWFDSVEALREAWTTPKGLAAGARLIEDEHEFIDVPRSPIWIAEQHVILGHDK
jgi:uncharacterized protein (TIGR02118 family)